ncbi:MAG TPA: hypothetical protein VG077_02440 [Verrucomicrobiae bacterium]|nr:hypothetical protein [Verrucomicrobiae bacterium]
MKRIFTILFCLMFAASLQAAIRFNYGKDPRKWAPPVVTGSDTATRFFLVGESIETWKEMVSIRFADTNAPLRKYVCAWKDGLLKTDPRIDIKEETGGDDSIIVSYTSLSADETCIRRFIKGDGGVYMLAYQVRPKFKKDEIFKIWEDIIRTATWIPNPKTNPEIA